MRYHVNLSRNDLSLTGSNVLRSKSYHKPSTVTLILYHLTSSRCLLKTQINCCDVISLFVLTISPFSGFTSFILLHNVNTNRECSILIPALKALQHIRPSSIIINLLTRGHHHMTRATHHMTRATHHMTRATHHMTRAACNASHDTRGSLSSVTTHTQNSPSFNINLHHSLSRDLQLYIYRTSWTWEMKRKERSHVRMLDQTQGNVLWVHLNTAPHMSGFFWTS